MKNRRLLICGLLFLVTGCGHLLYADGPYRGKVIDEETKQPIEGAAVVAIWWKETPAPHPIISYYDAQETLTDQQGNFTIPGIIGGSINPLAKIREPLFTIFKPGYEAFREVRLASTRKAEETTLELRRLTRLNERIKNLVGVRPGACAPETKQFCVPDEKIPNLIRLMNIEQRNVGQ